MFIVSLCFSFIMVVSAGWCTDEAEGKKRAFGRQSSQKDILSEHRENKENFSVNSSDFKAREGEADALNEQISFPHEIEDIYEAFGGAYEKGTWALITRKVMRQLALRASQGDSIAAFYLAHAFNHLRPVPQSICPLARKLYEKALEALEAVVSQTGDPSATAKERMLLAREYNAPVYLCHIPYISDKVDIALKYLEPLTTREAILLKYFINLKRGISSPPSIEDFLKEEDLKLYPWAFIAALDLLELGYKSRAEALEKAIQKSEHPVFLMGLVSIYQQYYEASIYQQYCNKGDHNYSEIYKDKCLSLLERAGSLGFPIAYREMAAFFVRYRRLEHLFNFAHATANDLEKCKECLDKAKDQRLPEAYFNLACYYYEEYKKKAQEAHSFEDKERLEKAILDYYKQAAKEGFWDVYATLENILSPDDPFFAEYPNLKTEKEKLFRQAMEAYK